MWIVEEVRNGMRCGVRSDCVGVVLTVMEAVAG
jgi:hypothetical protein